MKSISISSTLCLLLLPNLLITLSNSARKIPCPVQWSTFNPDEYSDLLSQALECGSGDFVSRVKVDTSFASGRMSPVDNQTYIAFPDGTTQQSSSFDLLVQGDVVSGSKCILSWLSSAEISSAPNYGDTSTFVLADPATSTYVGRAEIDGDSMLGGQISGASIYLNDNKTGNGWRQSTTFDVLTSAYEQLTVSLTDFEYDLSKYSDIEGATRRRAFGAEQLINSLPNSSFQQAIVHQDVFEEYFDFAEEDQRNWIGLGAVQVNMKLWFGSAIVAGTLDAGMDQLRITRQREVMVDRQVEMKDGEAQVCSSVVYLDNFPVQFKAKGTFEGSGSLTAEEIKEIVVGTGRSNVVVSGEKVTADFVGSVSGHFILRVVSEMSLVEKEGVCYSMINTGK